jgi:FeS assembly SUF system regulator
MIRVSKLTDYGFLLLTRFSETGLNQVHNARDVSAEVGVPQPTVSKLLKALARGGLLTAHRGAKGGYALARPADQITVADVISALEGPIGITDCSSDESCGLEGVCPTRTNWRRINNAVYRALQEITLAEMLVPENDRIGQPAELPCGNCPTVQNQTACTCSLDAQMVQDVFAAADAHANTTARTEGSHDGATQYNASNEHGKDGERSS